MLRCKENDLAVIITGAYAGYFVTVGKFVGRTKCIRISDRTVCVIDNAWEVFNNELCRLSPSSLLVEGDDHLQPIRPGRTPVTTETERRITA